MAQKYQWTVNVGGADHHFEYKSNKWLIVDGEKYKLKSASWFMQLIDYAVNIGDTTCRLVVIGTKVDLAVNGKFLGSGKDYEPVGSIPIIVTIFSAVSVILGFLLNSFVGMAIGVLLATLYFSIYLKKKKVGPVVVTFVIAIICQVAFGFGIALLLNSLMV